MSKNLQNEYDDQSADQSNGGGEQQKTLCGSACCYDALHLNGILQNPYAAASATILRVACNITGNREKRRRDNLSFLRFSVVKTHFRVNHNQPWL